MHMYIEAGIKMKEAAFSPVSEPKGKAVDCRALDKSLALLEALRLCRVASG